MSLMFSSEANLQIVIHFLCLFAIIWQIALGLSGITSTFTSYACLNFSSRMAAIPLGAWIIILRISSDNGISIEVIILSLKRTPRKIWDVLCSKLNIDYGKYTAKSLISLIFLVSLLHRAGYPGFPLFYHLDNPLCFQCRRACWLQLIGYLLDHRVPFAAYQWPERFLLRSSEQHMIRFCISIRYEQLLGLSL